MLPQRGDHHEPTKGRTGACFRKGVYWGHQSRPGGCAVMSSHGPLCVMGGVVSLYTDSTRLVLGRDDYRSDYCPKSHVAPQICCVAEENNGGTL